MEVKTVPEIAGALLFTTTPNIDERGFFCRTFDADVARAAGVDPGRFVQDSISRSSLGVIRGMHVRKGAGEAKLVRCSYGAIFDVIVDLRPESPTYLAWTSLQLVDYEQGSVYIPAGCAHGFQVLTGTADVSYRIDRPYDPDAGVVFAYNDPDLDIQWPLPVTIMSEADRRAPPLAAILPLDRKERVEIDLTEACPAPGAKRLGL